MKKVIIAVAVVGLVAFYFLSRSPMDESFIHGEWQKTQSGSQSSPITNMNFNPDGTMTFGDDEQIIYDDCTYSFYDQTTVDFECNVNGKKAVFPLKLKDGKSKIETTDGAIFEKK